MYITFNDYSNGSYRRLTVSARDVRDLNWDSIVMKNGTVYSDVSFGSMDKYYEIAHEFYEYVRNHNC